MKNAKKKFFYLGIFILFTISYCSKDGKMIKVNPNIPVALQIEEKIRQNKKISIEYLKVVEKEKGHILIEGIADLYGEKYYAQRIAEKFPISKIDNNISIRPEYLVNDSDLEREIYTTIMGTINLVYFEDISFKVSNGVVQLFGNVRELGIKDRIFERIIWIPGVRYVEDNIKMVPLSPQDDAIRVNILAAMKNDMRLSHYVLGSHPSIIIVVERGHVILKGYVNTNVDKVIAGQIARSVLGVIDVNNQLQLK